MFGGEGDDLTFERIKAKCRGIGYNYSDEELSAILEEFVTQGRLITLEVDGERVWKPIKVAKNPKKSRHPERRRRRPYGRGLPPD
jgi:hypothetical protein